jgi:hypothetical protein
VKVKAPDSIETKLFKVLKAIGLELSSYHGGSLNGKDIKKVMNNATYIFDQLALLFIERKRPDCMLLDNGISALCQHFREVFVLKEKLDCITVSHPNKLAPVAHMAYFVHSPVPAESFA